MNIKDGDYVLEDDAAWIEVGGLVVRLAYQDNSLSIGVYKTGREMEDPVFAIELEDEK